MKTLILITTMFIGLNAHAERYCSKAEDLKVTQQSLRHVTTAKDGRSYFQGDLYDEDAFEDFNDDAHDDYAFEHNCQWVPEF